MPRRGGFSKPSGFGFRSSKTAYRAPRAPTTTAPKPTIMGSPMGSGIGSTIVQGAAFGTGSALAHQAINSVTGSHQPNQIAGEQGAATTAQPEYPCTLFMNKFLGCLKENSNSIYNCQHYWGEVQSCEATHMGKQM